MKNHPEKDKVITAIEDDARGGEAFDEESLEVLYKLSVADLFRLSRAFRCSYECGRRKGREEPNGEEP